MKGKRIRREREKNSQRLCEVKGLCFFKVQVVVVGKDMRGFGVTHTCVCVSLCPVLRESPTLFPFLPDNFLCSHIQYISNCFYFFFSYPHSFLQFIPSDRGCLLSHSHLTIYSILTLHRSEHLTTTPVTHQTLSINPPDSPPAPMTHQQPPVTHHH